VAIAIRFGIVHRWHPNEKQWSQDYPPGFYTEARVWVVKKDGSLNDASVANLQACKLWDGDWDKLAGPPPSVFVHLDVDQETYEGKVRWRANWVNPDADEPRAGGFSPVDQSLLASLKQRFQGGTRAIAGGARGGQAPAPPPMPTPAVQPPLQPAVVGAPPAVVPAGPPVQPPATRPMPPQAARTPPAVSGLAPLPAPVPPMQAPAAPAAPRAPTPLRGFSDTPAMPYAPAGGDADDPMAVEPTPF
jgi:hypothetical protein